MKLLIIEDERSLRKSISEYLSQADFLCEEAADLVTAFEKVSLYEYACIILDINLPDGTGLDVLTMLKREKKQDGVLIISANHSLDDKINGLKSGADDYLTKPFHLGELAARVDAIIRRKHFGGNDNILLGEINVDLLQKQASIHHQPLSLTRKEYQLLLYFISNRNKVLSKNSIAEHLWGDDMDLADDYDFIYSHIKNLRKKILAAGGTDHIKAVYGMGYRFAE